MNSSGVVDVDQPLFPASRQVAELEDGRQGLIDRGPFEVGRHPPRDARGDHDIQAALAAEDLEGAADVEVVHVQGDPAVGVDLDLSIGRRRSVRGRLRGQGVLWGRGCIHALNRARLIPRHRTKRGRIRRGSLARIGRYDPPLRARRLLLRPGRAREADGERYAESWME